VTSVRNDNATTATTTTTAVRPETATTATTVCGQCGTGFTPPPAAADGAGAWSARAEPAAPGVAVVAALGAEVPGLALRAFVDGVDLRGLGWSGCCPAAAPGGLAAGVGALR
jgi:hypothetical protein